MVKGTTRRRPGRGDASRRIPLSKIVSAEPTDIRRIGHPTTYSREETDQLPWVPLPERRTLLRLALRREAAGLSLLLLLHTVHLHLHASLEGRLHLKLSRMQVLAQVNRTYLREVQS